jgi:hypothetical protein
VPRGGRYLRTENNNGQQKVMAGEKNESQYSVPLAMSGRSRAHRQEKFIIYI